MALPNPFNTRQELINFSIFSHGTGIDEDSIRNGTFQMREFDEALAAARNEIYVRTGEMDNADFSESRSAQLKRAEKWLAIAELMPTFAQRLAIVFGESNIQSVGEVMSGADTPPPSGPGSKAEFWAKFMFDTFRKRGIELLESPSTRFTVEVERIDLTKTYPALSAY